MIRHFYIDNFKSLVDFHLPPEPAGLAKFTCLIGPNGSGKSTVLQAFDFIKQLMHGRMDDWLEVREWKKIELTCRFLRKRLIGFRLILDFPEMESITWSGEFNPSLLRCTSESILLGDKKILLFADGIVRYATENPDELSLLAQGFDFQGSVLSALLIDKAHPAIPIMREFIRELKSLDMLAPNLMRKRSRDADDIGYGGERLSAFISGFFDSDRDKILDVLVEFYPYVVDVKAPSIRGGWKDLRMYEDFSGKKISVNSRQVNDGLLRILAIISQVEAKDYFKNRQDEKSRLAVIAKKFHLNIQFHKEYQGLFFDEIENGIHPELVEKLVAYLLEAQQQIIVTTHSPMILNYLPDEVAKEAVILLYRTPEGITRSVRYFDLPSARKKLDLLGPGEVFVDTDLATLTQEAKALRNASS